MNGSNTPKKTIGLIHAIFPAIVPMRDVIARMLPDVRMLNLWDEGLITECERLGGPIGPAVERLANHVAAHIEAGADAVLLTCTAYSNIAPEMRRRFPATPVLAVDQTMVEQAVATGTRIGVMASSATGLGQQTELLQTEAARVNKKIEIIPSLHPPAMAALNRGDRDEHDRIILAALPALIEKADVVLLAQVSMSPVAAKLPANLPKPVLSSPELAVERLREILFEAPATVS